MQLTCKPKLHRKWWQVASEKKGIRNGATLTGEGIKKPGLQREMQPGKQLSEG